MKVRAVALEQRMPLDAQDHIQIARMAAARPRLALTRQANACAAFDARRNGNGQRTFLARASDALAALARIFDDFARALTGRACMLNREKALLHAHASVPVAGRACHRRRSRGRPSAATGLTSDLCGYFDRLLASLERLIQRDTHVIAQIRAALSRWIGANDDCRRVPPPKISPNISSNIAETAGEIEAAKAAGAAAHTALLERAVAKAIIGRAFCSRHAARHRLR